jgi:hypothetical protein
MFGEAGIIAENFGPSRKIPRIRAGSTTIRKKPAISRKDAKAQRNSVETTASHVVVPNIVWHVVPLSLRLCDFARSVATQPYENLILAYSSSILFLAAFSRFPFLVNSFALAATFRYLVYDAAHLCLRGQVAIHVP